MAKLADAPDLGLRNHRFQRVAFRFKADAFYEWKTGFSHEIVAVANGDYNASRSSTDAPDTDLSRLLFFRFVSDPLPRTIFQRVPSARTSSAVTRPVSQLLDFFSSEY